MITILLLILMLAGCAPVEAAPVSDDTPATDIESATPQAPAPIIEREYKIKLPGAALPDAPYTPPAEQERFHGYKVYELIPSSTYGELRAFYAAQTGELYEVPEARYALVTTDFRIVCEPVFTNVYQYSNAQGTVYVCMRPERVKSGSNMTGDLVTMPGGATVCATDGSWVENFTQVNTWTDFLIVERDGKCGIMGYDGKYILPLAYDRIHYIYDDELFLASKGGKYGLMDITGKWFIEPTYEGLSYAGEQYMTARMGGKYGIIDSDENWVLEPMFDYPLYYSYGVSAMCDKGTFELYYVNLKGERVFDDLTLGMLTDGSGALITLEQYAEYRADVYVEEQRKVCLQLATFQDEYHDQYVRNEDTLEIVRLWLDGTYNIYTYDEMSDIYAQEGRGTEWTVEVDGKTYSFKYSDYSWFWSIENNGTKVVAHKTDGDYLLDLDGTVLYESEGDISSAGSGYIKVGNKLIDSNGTVTLTLPENTHSVEVNGDRIIYGAGEIYTYYGVIDFASNMIIPQEYLSINVSEWGFVASCGEWWQFGMTQYYFDRDGNLLLEYAPVVIRMND